MSTRRAGGRAGALLAAALLLGGCGGGVWVGIGSDDDPPRTALVVSPTQAVPGQTVTLLADARDDYGVDYVAFYQLLPDGSAIRLGIVPYPPYQLSVVLPADAAPLTQFFARAVDGANQFGDSTAAAVQVLR
jgi:hypothetical protein